MARRADLTGWPLRRLIAIALVLAAGAGAGYELLRQFSAPGPLEESHDVVVPHGSLEAVADALQQQSVIESRLLFRAAALATAAEGPLHAGELNFPRAASLEAVLSVLRTAGRSAPAYHPGRSDRGTNRPAIRRQRSAGRRPGIAARRRAASGYLQFRTRYISGRGHGAGPRGDGPGPGRRLGGARPRIAFSGAPRGTDPGKHRRARSAVAAGKADDRAGIPEPAGRGSCACRPIRP